MQLIKVSDNASAELLFHVQHMNQYLNNIAIVVVRGSSVDVRLVEELLDNVRFHSNMARFYSRGEQSTENHCALCLATQAAYVSALDLSRRIA